MVCLKRCRSRVDIGGKVGLRGYSKTVMLLTWDRPWERRRLNERPIYLRSVFMMLALAQTVAHLCSDYDRVPLPVDKGKHEDGAGTQNAALPPKLPTVVRPIEEIYWGIPSMLRSISWQTVSITVMSPICYALFIRKRAWEIAMFFARLFWDVAPAAELSYIPPYHISLIQRSFFSGFLLVLLWQSSNMIFTAFYSQEPLKNGQPLTAGSSIPNEALIDGLKSTKEINRVKPTSPEM